MAQSNLNGYEDILRSVSQITLSGMSRNVATTWRIGWRPTVETSFGSSAMRAATDHVMLQLGYPSTPHHFTRTAYVTENTTGVMRTEPPSASMDLWILFTLTDCTTIWHTETTTERDLHDGWMGRMPLLLKYTTIPIRAFLLLHNLAESYSTSTGMAATEER